MLNLSNKRFSEIVFDYLNDNLCEQHREALRNHISDDDYDRYVKVLKESEDPECTDEFCDLHSLLNEALEDDGAPTIEGFEQTLAEGVMVNHHCDVLTAKTIDEIRKEFRIGENDEVDVDLGTVAEGDCPIWDDFRKAYAALEPTIKTIWTLCICEEAGGELNSSVTVHRSEDEVLTAFRRSFSKVKADTIADIDGLELRNTNLNKQYKITCGHYVI